jgi:hypothetical protein
VTDPTSVSFLSGLLEPRFLLDMFQTVVIALLWIRAHEKKTDQHVDDVETQLEVLREKISHMPLRDELTRLEGAVAAIQTSMDAMKESSAVTRATVTRIEAFLLQAAQR